MKVKVLKTFIDKNTKALNNVGDVLNVTKARYEELRKAGNYVVEVKEAQVEAEK